SLAANHQVENQTDQLALRIIAEGRVVQIRLLRVRRIIKEGRGKRRVFCAHQMATGSVFDAGNGLAFAPEECSVVPESGAPTHHVAVVVRYSISDPQTARA